MADKPLSGMSTRQKIIAAVFIVVIIIIIWQAKGLFGGGGGTPTIVPAAPKGTMPMTGVPPAAGAPGMPAQGMAPQGMAPQPAQLQKPAAAPSPQEAEMMREQQETQARYVAALNELQFLKVTKEIAETNQAIMKAKLETVTAEKNILQQLSPSTPPTTPQAYAQGLAGGIPAPTGAPAPAPTAAPVSSTETYTVISVTRVQYKWSAVLGYQGNLYNVSVGDVLPVDGAKVISIDKSGVVLEKNGEKKKFSLVPII